MNWNQLRSSRTIVTVVVLLLIIALVSVPVAGEIITESDNHLTVETEYPHPDQNSQAVSVTATFTPENSQVTDLTITVDETRQSFVDFDSFSVEQRPGDIDTNVTYVGNGEFQVQDDLQAGETIIIRYNVFPRNIRTSSLSVTSVEADYVQNGQDISDSVTVSADLSSSFYFQFQDAKRNNLIAYGAGGAGAVFGVVGIVAAVFLYRGRSDAISDAEEDAEQEIVGKLNNVIRQYDDNIPVHEIRQIANEHGSITTPPIDPDGEENPIGDQLPDIDDDDDDDEDILDY